ncbi:MFS transporter [Nonomuraea sp. NPDC049695]|uniref:MFS transporter n=1 Tax=Nonomuraea sp. NPDC049695 TaxID=3154734 RepID=UPI0034277A9A
MTGPNLTTRSTQGAAEESGGRWWMLAVLLLGQFMGLLDVFIVNVAMPVIGADLHTSGASLQLVIGGYTTAYAMLLITGARLGALYGRRRAYATGVIVFTAASLACGLAPDSVALILFRFVQGAGAAVMIPQVMSIIQMHFTGQARARALSAYGLVLSVGSLIGLLLGGVLVSARLLGGSWRPVFLVNVPIGIILTVLVPRLVPADRPGPARRLDLAGLAIALPAVVLIVLPLVLGREAGWPAWIFASLAAGLALVALFVLVERRIAASGGDPLLNLEVLNARGIRPGLLTLSAAQISYGGFLFAFTLHLESGLGADALRAGLTYIPLAAAFGLVGYFWRRLPERMHHMLVPIGLALCVAGYAGTAVALRDGGQPGALLWIAQALYGAGLGASVSPLLTQGLAHVPPARAADASGLFTTTMQLGQLTGVAVFGSVFLALAPPPLPQSSPHAIAVTSAYLAALTAVGLISAFSLARAVRRPA